MISQEPDRQRIVSLSVSWDCPIIELLIRSVRAIENISGYLGLPSTQLRFQTIDDWIWWTLLIGCWRSVSSIWWNQTPISNIILGTDNNVYQHTLPWSQCQHQTPIVALRCVILCWSSDTSVYWLLIGQSHVKWQEYWLLIGHLTPHLETWRMFVLLDYHL